MKKIFNKSNGLFAVLLIACGLSLTSCSDWLDVRGENIQKEDDQFESYKGFRDVLTGCYMKMGNANIYGQKLTMTDIECMADLWYNNANLESTAPLKYYLSTHQYSKDEPAAAMKAIYGSLFTTITSANILLKNIEEEGRGLSEKTAMAVIEGEAYAIRAYCQFDLLRLFGQLPQGGTKTVKLPYSESCSIDEMPPYYDFNSYVQKLTSDITKAEQLLKDNDPIFGQTFTQLNNPGTTAEDNFMYYRQARLNYWAVRALHARMALYLGNTTEAHSIAMEIINAKGADGNALISLSGTTDFQRRYNALPSECLFYISKYNLLDYTIPSLIGGSDAQSRDAGYIISEDQLTDLYASIPGATASHNRFINEWNRATRNPSSKITPALKKYWYDANNLSSTLASSNASELATKLQIIPMLRLSEVYLIAIETSENLAEAQGLYDTYMAACEFTLYEPFASLEAVRAEMVNEYRRELFGEGQMFFTYKRLASDNMMWNSNPIEEDDYIVPLPATEYDPALIQK